MISIAMHLWTYQHVVYKIVITIVFHVYFSPKSGHDNLFYYVSSHAFCEIGGLKMLENTNLN